ncbi:MAG: helix-turn-helix transcriptional regulator [Acidobacteriota bacterium]|nr:helix-turn-helix transcriptional regulator [Acidobacteriota bacterium]
MKTKTALGALAALAQESRLAIFRYLVEAGLEGSSVGPIAEALDLPAATLSFHLKELTHAALLVSRQEGRFIWYSANFETMNGLVAYLTENCCGGRPQMCGPSCTPTKANPKTTRKRIPA